MKRVLVAREMFLQKDAEDGAQATKKSYEKWIKRDTLYNYFDKSV